MKKIAILTLPFNNNYGGLLQSYALQKYLAGRGHEVILISNVQSSLDKINLKFKIKNFIKVIIGKKAKDNERMRKISKNMLQFVNDNMSCTQPIYNEKDLFLLEKYNFDAYIVGSDQVWRFDYTGNDFGKYFFNFIKSDKVKRISFAASFGIDKWTKNEYDTKYLSSLIHKFQAISVREKSGVSLCNDNLGVTATHLLDPVFLLPINDYQKLIPKKEKTIDSLNDNGLLVYMLDYDEDKKKAVELISQTIKQKPFRVGVKQLNRGKFNQDMIYPSVSEWIDGFLKAKYIITDSFHGCVFAILFNKPFIVYGNNSRGLTRFDSLLETFNLKSRFITNSLELRQEVITENICFDKTNEIISQYRKDANTFFEKVNM